MITRRAFWITITAFLFYFFANQTQVGWLYIMSALMLAALLASAWLNQGMLRGLAFLRTFDSGTASGQSPEVDSSHDLYEGDSLQIALRLRNPRRATAWQINIQEHCPLAAQDSAERHITLFAPIVPARSEVIAHYQVTIDRRGLHEFPPITLSSGAPFGFFRRKRLLNAISRVLVFPEVRRISHLDLLDDRLSPEMMRLRVGYSAEVIGARPFRSGDSPRHIHWRSTARQGSLISKEFADDAQPGLILALDVFKHPYADTENKHTPFEWAIKVAVTLAEYATQRNYPLTLLADQAALAVPAGQVSWLGTLQYMARIQPTGHHSMGEVLTQYNQQNFYAVILPWPDPSALAPLIALHHRGVAILVVLLDPETFQMGGPSAKGLADAFLAANIETRLIHFGEDWIVQLQPNALPTTFSSEPVGSVTTGNKTPLTNDLNRRGS